MKRLLIGLCVLAASGCQQKPSPAQTPAQTPTPTPVAPAVAPVSTTAPAAPPPVHAPVSLESQPYGFDFKKLYPAAWSQWDDGVRTSGLPRQPWLDDVDGPSHPIRPIAVSGRAYHFVEVCKPHACGLNQLDILVTPDQSRLTGAVWIAKEGQEKPDATLIGSPTPAEEACLRKLYADADAATC